jgi:molybdopterin synthase sulfur carrier subunit
MEIMSMMQINILFFGRLKQDVGEKQKTLELQQNSLTIDELMDILKAHYPALEAQLATVAYAVNDELVESDYVLHDGDRAALLPPVSGG